jgi:hypothetical protein
MMQSVLACFWWPYAEAVALRGTGVVGGGGAVGGVGAEWVPGSSPGKTVRDSRDGWGDSWEGSGDAWGASRRSGQA